MRPTVAAAFAYLSFMWGSTYLFIKIGVHYWPPFLMSSVRNLVACGTLVLLMWAMKRRFPQGWREWWPPLVFGVLNGTPLALIGWGEQYIPSGQTAVIIATVPIFTLVLAWWWGGERPKLVQASAVALGLAGVFLATGVREGAGFVGSDGQRLAGQFAMLAAAALYASSYVFGKKYFKADPLANTMAQLGGSGAYLMLLSLLFDGPAKGPVLSLPALGAVLYLALPGSAVAYFAMFYLLEKLSSVGTTYVTMINPIVALLLGVAVMGEHISAAAVAGTGLVLVGVWLINRKPPAQQGPHQQPDTASTRT